jgi:protein-L-isoaspartate(D-aspartate) O-methyltransferase
MIQILREKGITDSLVIEAINKVPRHQFLDKAFLEYAYQDRAFAIGRGQTISAPFTVAYQTQLLNLQPGMKALEIGTGSGYQAAVLAECGVKVYTIERIVALHEKSKDFLKRRGYRNIQFFKGDGFEGLPSFAPYDRILITAAAPEIPSVLLSQLCVGGIMVIPLGEGEVQKMQRITKVTNEEIHTEILEDFSFVPMLKGLE